MKVTVQVIGHLREFYPHLGQPAVITLDQPATVSEILRQAGVPLELPGAVICNGQRVAREHVSADGDEILVLSPMSGG